MSNETGDLGPGPEYAEVIVQGQRERVKVSRCRDESCAAAMIWTVGPRGGKIPVDAVPTERGPYVLEGPARALSAAYAPEGTPADRRYESHFKTCPAARKFGKKRRGPTQEKRVVGATQPERAPMKCPECGAAWASAPVDASCGDACFDRGVVTKLVRA